MGTGGESSWNWDSGIITLVMQQKEVDEIIFRRFCDFRVLFVLQLSSHRIPQGRGRPSAAVREAIAAAATQQNNLVCMCVVCCAYVCVLCVSNAVFTGITASRATSVFMFYNIIHALG